MAGGGQNRDLSALLCRVAGGGGMKKTTRLLLGKETPLRGERDVVADSEGTNEVCAAGSPVMAALLWLVVEDEEESVGFRRR